MSNKYTLIATALLTTITIAAAFGSTKTEQLHHIVRSINSLNLAISHNNHQRSLLQNRLKKNEINIGILSKQLDKTENKLKYQHNLLEQLHRNQLYYNIKLTNQKQTLAKEINATYILSRQPYIKILLNNEHPHKLSRMYTYYKYLEQSRAKTIAELNETLMQLHRNRIKTEKQTKSLRTLAYQQKNELHRLKQLHSNRAQLLHKINFRLKHQSVRLQQLINNKKSLELVIDRLKAISPIFATPLNKLRHKLHWPTKGKIVDLFGHKIDHSQLQWHGVLIKAHLGQQIHAIATGKVVFAQWLQGYGLLLIIDHGHGYLTLYARNNSLYKTVGNIVQRGDLIATVGNSGGYQTPALYFSIRHNSNPVDPKKWCRA